MDTSNFHSLLRRQLKHHFTAQRLQECPEDVRHFFNAVNESYLQSDEDRGMIERSLELSSKELLQAYSELRGIFQAFPDYFFRVDREGVILGFKAEDTRGDIPLPASPIHQRLTDLFETATAAKFQEAIDKASARGNRVAFEFALAVNSQRRYYEARLLPLSQAPTLSGQLMIIIRNITTRKVAENRLEEYTLQLNRSYQDLSDFTFLASHDIQEPLERIEDWTRRLIALQPTTDSAGQEYTAQTLQTVRRMRTLVNDLLDYSKVSAHICEFGSTSLQQVVEGLLTELEPWLKKIGASVHCTALPCLEADAALMRQLFQQLISNACKFRQETLAPCIKIYERPQPAPSTSDGGPFCQIIVEDNGIGFNNEDAQKLFRVFQRLHDREKYEGSGIGLALCRRIIDRHGGRITVESAPGQGARFLITLPLKRPIKDDFPI